MALLPPNIPPRSRLYNIEPIGVGTPYVECLSGYTARLAEKHSSTLYYLFSREVAPLINKPGTINHRVSFGSFNKAANGLGVIAADLVEVFERLTLRRDLRMTTMLPWRGALSSNSLTREARAWCPSCYEECAVGRKEVYDQLIWSVQCVTACARHNRWLEDRCLRCDKEQLALSHRVRPGFCGRCQSWLGKPSAGSAQVQPLRLTGPREEELRVAEEVGKLLALAPDLMSRAATVSFTRNLGSFVGRVSTRRGEPSQIQLPADKQTIGYWLKGSQTPTLPLLLKTCFSLGVSPINLLCNEDSGQENKTDISVPSNRSVNSHGKTTNEENIVLPVNWRDEKSVACVEKKLQDATCADPPTSLTKLAREIKCTKSTLRKKFPELAAQIAKKADTYYRPRLSNQEILRELSAALSEHPPPPLQEISRRLGAGASATTLHNKFPEESRMIVERYCAHSKRRLDNNLIEKRLRAFLERVPAPSMPEVAHEMGISRATLHQKFPVLYKALSNRFAEYRREKNALNRERVKAEIKSICERAFKEGIYPDSMWVRSRLTVPCQAEVFSKIRRDVLAEMGDAL